MTGRTAVLLAIVVVMGVMSSGCATIMHGRTETISITSDPSGAVAHVGGQEIVTPGEITLDRNKSYTVTFEKPGYESATARIRSQRSGWIWGNILIGGIPGIIVDLATGSAGDLTPNIVSVTLVRAGLSDAAIDEPVDVAVLPREDRKGWMKRE